MLMSPMMKTGTILRVMEDYTVIDSAHFRNAMTIDYTGDIGAKPW